MREKKPRSTFKIWFIVYSFTYDKGQFWTQYLQQRICCAFTVQIIVDDLLLEMKKKQFLEYVHFIKVVLYWIAFSSPVGNTSYNKKITIK